MKRLFIAVVVVGGLFAWGWCEVREAHAQQTRFQQLMQKKLLNSQKILEAITLGDHKKVEEAAEELILISKTAEWFAYKTPRYDLHSNEFRRAAENLVQKAKAKNQDGLVLAYLDLTMSCVRCHTYVREIRDAKLP
jgi:hypothetical protein